MNNPRRCDVDVKKTRTLDKFQRWEYSNRNQFGKNPYLIALLNQCVNDSNKIEDLESRLSDAEEENKRLKEGINLSEAQNYCKICGDALDRYKADELLKEGDHE